MPQENPSPEQPREGERIYLYARLVPANDDLWTQRKPRIPASFWTSLIAIALALATAAYAALVQPSVRTPNEMGVMAALSAASLLMSVASITLAVKTAERESESTRAGEAYARCDKPGRWIYTVPDGKAYRGGALWNGTVLSVLSLPIPLLLAIWALGIAI